MAREISDWPTQEQILEIIDQGDGTAKLKLQGSDLMEYYLAISVELVPPQAFQTPMYYVLLTIPGTKQDTHELIRNS